MTSTKPHAKNLKPTNNNSEPKQSSTKKSKSFRIKSIMRNQNSTRKPSVLKHPLKSILILNSKPTRNFSRKVRSNWRNRGNKQRLIWLMQSVVKKLFVKQVGWAMCMCLLEKLVRQWHVQSVVLFIHLGLITCIHAPIVKVLRSVMNPAELLDLWHVSMLPLPWEN